MIFIVFRTEKKLKEHENICKVHEYSYLEMPNDNNKILKQPWRRIYENSIFYLL